MAGLLSIAILGCDRPEKIPAPGNVHPKDTGRIMGAVFQTLDNPFFRELNEGIKEVVESNGDQLVTLDSDWNSSEQGEDIASLLERDVTFLFLNPVDWEGLQDSLLDAKDQGVSCVVVDTQIKDDELVLCQVVSDNVEAGRLAARSLAKTCRPARIVILHIPLNKACIDRVKGFREEVSKYSDMEILDVEDGMGTDAGARSVMRELCRKHPDMNAVFAVNDPSALGAAGTLEAEGRLDAVTVVSVDGSPEGIAAVAAGKLFSTSVQFPREIGRIAAQRAYDYLNDYPVEKSIKVPLELVTPENVDAFLSACSNDEEIDD